MPTMQTRPDQEPAQQGQQPDQRQTEALPAITESISGQQALADEQAAQHLQGEDGKNQGKGRHGRQIHPPTVRPNVMPPCMPEPTRQKERAPALRQDARLKATGTVGEVTAPISVLLPVWRAAYLMPPATSAGAYLKSTLGMWRHSQSRRYRVVCSLTWVRPAWNSACRSRQSLTRLSCSSLCCLKSG